jgi:hypothetical protein
MGCTPLWTMMLGSGLICVCVCVCVCVCGSGLWQACVKVCVCVCQVAFFLCAWLPYWFPLRGGWQLGARCIILLRSLTIPYFGRGDVGLTISTAGAASRHGPDGLCLLSGCCVASPCVGSPYVRRDNVLLLLDHTSGYSSLERKVYYAPSCL